MSEADLALDHSLAELCGLTPLLSMVTPVNVAEARDAFYKGEEPIFEYRELPDVTDLQHRLDGIRREQATDPGIAAMAEALVGELNLRLEMFRHRGTEQFFLTSVEMFGHVDEPTLRLAHSILDADLPPATSEPMVEAADLLLAAEDELDHYRARYPEMSAVAKISTSRPGLMVETGHLHIGESAKVAKSRVPQLLQHEVGTHIVTFENGRAQPLQMLGLGLAGYDELQEALGVLAEYLTGELPPSRLRVLAYRVIAAQVRSDGGSFRECFDRLMGLGCSRGVAFTTTMRAYRSGGMTKDVIYLRGLVRLLKHLADGGTLEPLFVGKISFGAIPLIAELRERKVLTDPPLRPRFLDFENAQPRLERVQAGAGLAEIGGIAA